MSCIGGSKHSIVRLRMQYDTADETMINSLTYALSRAHQDVFKELALVSWEAF